MTPPPWCLASHIGQVRPDWQSSVRSLLGNRSGACKTNMGAAASNKTCKQENGLCLGVLLSGQE